MTGSLTATRARRGLFGVLAAGLLLRLAGCSDDAASPLPNGACVPLPDGSCATETFHNPPVLEPNAEGVYELSLRPTEFSFNGQRHCGRAYNGMYPAPTIDTKYTPGGSPRQVRVNLRNEFTKPDVRSLGSEPCTCSDENGASCTPSGEHGSHDTCTCVNADGDLCHYFDFNTTNLHAHGSHVRPDYATGGGCVAKDGLGCRTCTGDRTSGSLDCYYADDVLSRVHPGEGVQHRWDIDEDGVHHAGLDWYHPHIHGTTAIQVASGATGAWIVRGALDEIPGIKNAKERILLITTPPIDYTPLADGEPCDEDHITFNDFSILGSTAAKQTNLINGIRRPRMLMPPGQIERWRFLHGAFLDEVALVLFHGIDPDCKAIDLTRPPVALTQIGRDGVALPKPPSGEDWPYAPDYIFMSPGYRVEALLDGSKLKNGDNLCLVSGRFLQEDTTGTTDIPVGLTELPTPEEILKAASNGDLIAIVNVTDAAGTPTETVMPDLEEVAKQSIGLTLQDGAVDVLERCQEVEKISDPAAIDQLAFLWAIFYNTDGLDACGFPDHNINAKNFEHTDRDVYPYDRVLKKGAVDHWRLQSGFDGHPFHIHINPFLVCPLPPAGSPDPRAKSRLFEPPFAHWRDTYLVNLDRVVDVLTEYRAFTGDFVFHCHKLNHEDHGMMELVHVCDPATEDCDTLCSGGKCGWQDCAEGDTSCERALAATECLLDPSICPEAVVRCTPCSANMSCPPGGYCGEVPDESGQQRCVPGCQVDDDCPLTHACQAGECAPVMCSPPCAPPTTCQHGVCQ